MKEVKWPAENVIFTGMQPSLFQYLGCGKPVVATKLPGTIMFLLGDRSFPPGIPYISDETWRRLWSFRRSLFGRSGGIPPATAIDWNNFLSLISFGLQLLRHPSRMLSDEN
jgi:hypothetical protein